MKYLSLFAILCSSLLGGCASLSKEQCLGSDWQQIGFNDGVEGQTVNRLDDHIKACAEHGVTPNTEQYYAGRSQGLLNYCQPNNAFNIGRRGLVENVAACPPNMQTTFMQQYSQGREINAMERDINEMRSRLANNNFRFNTIGDRIVGINNALRASDLSNDARTALMNEFNRLLNEKNLIIRDNDFLQRELDRRYDILRMRLRDFGR